MFQRVIKLEFFGRAISNDKKVEKEIIIQPVAVQLTDGAGQNLRAHQGESQFQLLRMRKYNKVIFNSRSTGEFVNDFTVKLPCEVVRKLLCYGNFILSPTVCTYTLRFI